MYKFFVLIELGWWLLRHFDQDVQGIFFAFLWWALVLLNAHVGEFKFTGYSFFLSYIISTILFWFLAFVLQLFGLVSLTHTFCWLIFLFCWKIHYNVIGEKACLFPFLCFPSLFYFLFICHLYTSSS